MRNFYIKNVLLSFMAGIVIVLSGCASSSRDFRDPLSETESQAYQSQLAAEGATPSDGLLIGSFAYFGHNPSGIAKAFGSADDFNYSSYQYYFRPTTPPVEGELPIMGDIGFSIPEFFGSFDADFKLEQGEGHVFAIPLPPGDYAFYQFRFWQNDGSSQSSWQARQEFSIPFTIKAGVATYIGEVRAVHRRTCSA